MLKIFPKMLSEISQNFHLLCSSCSIPLILISECSIRVFHYSIRDYQSKVPCRVHLGALLQFPLTALLGSIYLLSCMELSSII